jgi:hypothetical protein
MRAVSLSAGSTIDTVTGVRTMAVTDPIRHERTNRLLEQPIPYGRIERD